MINRLEKFKDIHNSLSIDESKISEGSWWGSRFFARWGLRSLAPEERKYRLNLLRLLSKSIPDMRGFENVLSDKNTEQAFISSRKMIAWGEFYIDTVLSEFKGLMQAASEEMVDKDKLLTKEPIIEESLIKKVPAEKLSKIEIDYLPIKKNIELINNDILFAQELFNKIDILKGTERAIEINKKCVAWLALYANPASQEFSNIPKLANDIIIDYKRLLSTANKALKGDAASFKELYSDIEDNNKIAEIILKQKRIEKIAHNVITRWLRRKLLGMSGGLRNQTRLMAVEKLKEATDMLDPLMDKLENKDIAVSDILKDIVDINQLLIRSFLHLKVFIDGYFHMQTPKGKDSKHYELKRVERNFLIKSIDSIVEKLKSIGV